jgi:hypothetical protein
MDRFASGNSQDDTCPLDLEVGQRGLVGDAL